MSNPTIVANSGRCIGCAACICLCPFGALEVKDGERGFPVPQKHPNCDDCGACLAECPIVDRDEEE